MFHFFLEEKMKRLSLLMVLLMATPALSDGVMYVRGMSSLFAIDARAPELAGTPNAPNDPNAPNVPNAPNAPNAPNDQ